MLLGLAAYLNEHGVTPYLRSSQPNVLDPKRVFDKTEGGILGARNIAFLEGYFE